MNLNQFQKAIANRLGIDNGDGTTVPYGSGQDSTNITGWINDAINQVLMDTHCYVKSEQITPGATADFTLPAEVFEIVDLYPTVSGVSYGMQRISGAELLDMRRFSPVAAAPTIYYALWGHNLLLFHPAPGATDTFTLYYVPVPTALSASGDDPSNTANGGIPIQFHKAIEFYACSEAADANDDQSSQYGQKYLLLYQDQIKRARRELLRRGGQLGQKAIVGPRGPRGVRRGAHHANDVY